MPPWYAYPIVAVGPLAIHFSAMIGTMLLAPIRSGVGVFDKAYNTWPWLPSSVCGAFAAIALAAQASGGRLFLIAAAVTASFFVIDLLGTSLSFYAWMLD